MNEIASLDIRCTAPAASVFARWIDVETHPEWSHGLAWVHLDGPMRLGATGKLKPKRGPGATFEVTTLDLGVTYADTSRLPGVALLAGGTS